MWVTACTFRQSLLKDIHGVALDCSHKVTEIVVWRTVQRSDMLFIWSILTPEQHVKPPPTYIFPTELGTVTVTSMPTACSDWSGVWSMDVLRRTWYCVPKWEHISKKVPHCAQRDFQASVFLGPQSMLTGVLLQPSQLRACTFETSSGWAGWLPVTHILKLFSDMAPQFFFWTKWIKIWYEE